MLLTAEGVSVTYSRRRGDVAALSGASLTVTPGELLVVEGPSGSGKSTLLHVLGTLQAPAAGRVLLQQQDVYRLSRGARRALRRRAIGFLFQSFHLVSYLTAEENVRAALTIKGHDDDEATALLERVGLDERRDHLCDELSVGERQRVALARAMAGRPPLLLADEPTGNLDPANAEIVIAHLRRYAEAGGAVVVVTHDSVLRDHAHRVLRIRGGCLV